MGALMHLGMTLTAPLLRTMRKTPHEGAYGSIFAAISPTLEGRGGLYMFHCQEILAGKAARDVDVAAKLWTLSEKLTGLVQEEKKIDCEASNVVL